MTTQERTQVHRLASRASEIASLCQVIGEALLNDPDNPSKFGFAVEGAATLAVMLANDLTDLGSQSEASS